MMSALHGHTSLELAVHVGIKSVMPGSQSEQNKLTCSGLFILLRLSDWLVFRCCCFHSILGKGFDDGLFSRVSEDSETR